MSWFVSDSLPLDGLKLLKRQRLEDDRGFFSRLFCAEELHEAGWEKPVVQVNHSYTRNKGAVRGMHYQHAPHAEMKLVSVMRGEIWDVAVDVRKGSSTFLQWHAEVLSSDNQYSMLIPEGFAHGFQAMTADVEVLYCHSAAYNKEAESGLSPSDARLDIEWPMPISDLSPRDSRHPLIDDSFSGISL